MSKFLSIGVLFIITSTALAANEPIFTKSVPNAITADQAILASASGETVLKCTPVEMKVSKSGTSVSLRAKKKSITKEAANEKIKEIQKQVED